MTAPTDTLTRRRLLGLIALAAGALPTTGQAQGQKNQRNPGNGAGGRAGESGPRSEPQGSRSSTRTEQGADNRSGAANQIRVVDLDPNSPNAVALGYTADNQRVDTRRWTKKSKDTSGEQRCSTCALYRGADASGGTCSIFSGKRVAANGWCNAWTQS